MTFGNPIELNSTGQTCSLHFFKNVKNGLDIRKKLMSGQIDATIINAELIPDVLQIFVAANKASLSHSSNGKKLTKTIHTEVLYNLSPSRSVTESLKMFGIGEETSNLFVLVFDSTLNSSIKDLIEGDLVSLNEHETIVNWLKIKELHGIQEEDLDQDTICDLVTSKSAVKELLF